VLLLTTRSWLGKEDYELERNLRDELSGILNFALDGLQRLAHDNENRFTRFAAAEEAITIMRDLASPVGAFVREKCKLDANAEIPVDVLYPAYKDWCQICEYPKSPKAHFGRDLRAACPSVRKTRPRDGTNRQHVYAGIRLRTEKDEADEEVEAAEPSPFSTPNNPPVTVTTMTSSRARSRSGHGGHSDQLNVAPNTEGGSSPAREREPGTDRGKSDDFHYRGPIIDVPDLGPDALDEHGAPRAATLTQGRIRELAAWYLSEAAARQEASETRDPDQAGLNTELRAILRQEVSSPEQVEIEFNRVTAEVFAVSF